MLGTVDYYLAAEIDYRRERIARDWAAARPRATAHVRWRRPLRRPTLRLPHRRPRAATVA